ncbi:MAG: diguanylate cyclase [Bacteroides sp. SM23_62_1]|nr:MAG: diguanylate cyclase [Bacteroides sp. SM23_62_1]
MKYIHDFEIVENRKINDEYFVLGLKSPQKLPFLQPGQFVEIKVDHSPTTFLRRPISIYDVDYKRNTLSLLILIVGNGTLTLSRLLKGDHLNLIYPLGNSFSIPSKGKVLLIGGGVGVAPLLFLGKSLLEKNIQPLFLFGARSHTHLVDLGKFEKLGAVHTTTEDGTQGEKGLVTEHSLVTRNDWDYSQVYACGPVPMMKAVARLAEKRNTICEVSLENTMACGFGACLTCVQETVRGNICICTEGPVFNTKELVW